MHVGFAYCQPRIQARFAALADTPTWHHLQAARGQSAYIEEARHTPLAHWVDGLSLASDIRHIEQGLRRRLLQIVRETRDWSPPPWQAAVSWLEWLPDLPLLHHVLKRHQLPDWIYEDSPLYPLFKDHPDKPQTLLGTDAATVWLERADPDRLANIWLSRWRESWPRCSRRERSQLDSLIGLLRDSAIDQALEPALRRLIRRHPLRPVIVFAWLALAALEMRRLRGDLVIRAAFPPLGET